MICSVCGTFIHGVVRYSATHDTYSHPSCGESIPGKDNLMEAENHRLVSVACDRALELIRSNSTKWDFRQAVGYSAQLYGVSFSSIVREMNRRRKESFGKRVGLPTQYTLDI